MPGCLSKTPRRTLLLFARSYGLMRQTTHLRLLWFSLVHAVFAGCRQSLLTDGPSRYYPLRRRLDPYPAVPSGSGSVKGCSAGQLMHPRAPLKEVLRYLSLELKTEAPMSCHGLSSDKPGAWSNPPSSGCPTFGVHSSLQVENKQKTTAIASLVRLIVQIVTSAHAEQEHKHE